MAHWEPRYDARKYPLDFLLRHGASARNAQSPEALKDALVALLHWKDGKARNFVPGESHAKPNTVRPIVALREAALVEFATLFRCMAEADDKTFVRCTQNVLDSVCRMWGSVVIPAFVLHVARPDRLPIIDQHTVRAFLQLIRAEVIEEPRIAWHLWKEYIVFFQDAIVAAGASSDLQGRYRVDRALFAYGQSLKARLKERRRSGTSATRFSSARTQGIV